MILAQGLPWGCSHVVVQGCSHSRLGWDWMICCQDGLHIVLPLGPPQRDACLLGHGSCFPSQWEISGKPAASYNVCFNLASQFSIIFAVSYCLHRPALSNLEENYTKVSIPVLGNHRRLQEADYCTYYTSPPHCLSICSFLHMVCPLPSVHLKVV